jgi:hypothetical protein
VNPLIDNLVEILETAVTSSFEPQPVQFKAEHEHEVPRVRARLTRTRDGNLGRFRPPVNRNGFLLGCLDYTELKGEEHLIVGYGIRHGFTTKIESLHHVVGGRESVSIPATVAHTLWDHYGSHQKHEVILFHNHPETLLSQLLDHLPLPSRADRMVLESRALQPIQLFRRLLGQGRVLFFRQQNGFVREFTLPSVLDVLARAPSPCASEGLNTSR